MTSFRLVAACAIALAGCYSQTPTPQYPQQEEVSGPPGGGMDQPTFAQYEADTQPAQSYAPAQGYQDPGYAPDDSSQPVEPQPSADPQDPGYTMGPVNDAEIDSTLGSYGEWVEDPDYGRVWRPNATVVGVDFTPYESCGQWIWTDWGWSYSCDWSWGWLPFHYGRWGWMDAGYWGWVPGYEWGPGWVDWRHGGGYVGWRPSAPMVRDHRGEHDGPHFHDHRSGAGNSQWRFVSQHDFGNGHIHGHLFNDPAEGLRVTQPVAKPDVRGLNVPVRVASTMRARMENPVWQHTHAPLGGWRQPVQAGRAQLPPQQGWRQPPAQSWQGVRQAPPQQQGWRQPVTVPRQPAQTWQQPNAGWRQPPPRQTWSPPPSQHPMWNAPRATQAPAQSWNAPRPAYNPPAYHPGPAWNAPRPSAPSSGWSRPSGGMSAPVHSWSAPSHSSGGSSFGGGGHSFGGGGGGGHSGGGGHHR